MQDGSRQTAALSLLQKVFKRERLFSQHSYRLSGFFFESMHSCSAPRVLFVF